MKIPSLIDEGPGEVFAKASKCNKLTYFIINCYEMILITLALGLSIYQDDASSFIYLFIMQAVQYYSMKEKGKFTHTQTKIVKGLMFVLLLLIIIKCSFMLNLGFEITIQVYDENMIILKTAGYNFSEVTKDDGQKMMQLDIWNSYQFESIAMIISLLLLKYYIGQTDNRIRNEPYQYIHHSLFLASYKTLQYIFFFAVVVDTFFCQTFIQLAVLLLIFVVLMMWAYGLANMSRANNVVVRVVKIVINIQLTCVALFQIAFMLEWIKEVHTLHDIMIYFGLIFNPDVTLSQRATHSLLLCLILSTSHFSQTVKYNYKVMTLPIIKQKEAEAEAKALLAAQEEGLDAPVAIAKKTKTIMGSISKFDYSGFVTRYLPYLCLWICRFCSIIMAYLYYGYPGFVILTWILLSFIVPIVAFVKWTSIIYLPFMITTFIYEYFINVQHLFTSVTGIYRDIPRNGDPTKTIHPVEICTMVLNILFLSILVSTRHDLSRARNEFKEKLFGKMADEKRNILWQLGFFILKRIHIILLSVVFLFGMKEINIYYIGLLYFFIKYVSSLESYRKSGPKLVAFAGFFIWTMYIWNLIKTDFNISPDSSLYKFFTMLTLSDYNSDKNIAGTDEINKYMEKPIPISMWLVLMLHVFMRNVNRLFQLESKKKKSLLESKILLNKPKDAEYYEEKIDANLTKKFPTLAKIFIRVRVLLSEMMILTILIVQTIFLAFQKPNIMYWGFLISSLILQAVVISKSYGNKRKDGKDSTDHAQEEKNFRMFAILSKVLKQYSSIVLISQIAYHFINDPNFLGKYGFDKVLSEVLETAGISEYMEIIGFHIYGKENKNLIIVFLSPIIFYITASILKDHFNDKIASIKKDKAEEIEHESKMVNGLASQLISKAKKEQQRVESKEDIIFRFERVRFTVPFLIYQRMDQWRLMDSLALHFHLVTATVTVLLCMNWQISMFMFFQLVCVVALCWRIAYAMYKYGRKFKKDNQVQGLSDQSTRDQIDTKKFAKEYITIDKAYEKNKSFKLKASERLMEVRQGSWYWQYWLLIVSMILMYPSPILHDVTIKHPELQTQIDNLIYWLFWSGIYVNPSNVSATVSHGPLYILITVLVLDKISQGWHNSRYGCTIQRVREFKELEEQVARIKAGQDHTAINDKSQDAFPILKKGDADYITVMEAKNECARIESRYREQTKEVKENRIKHQLILSLKRKYTNVFMYAIKFLMEQMSLQLLLFSCAHKSNFVSIIYLGLLLVMLVIPKKQTGMRYILNTIGLVIIIEYIFTLTNLTIANSPMNFPSPFELYPCHVETNTVDNTQFVKCPDSENPLVYWFPWFMKFDFLRENLEWAFFFGIDVQYFKVNDVWFDFANLLLLVSYFFMFGNQSKVLAEAKISFSKTSRLEKLLKQYTKFQEDKKKALIEKLTTDQDGNKIANVNLKAIQDDHEDFLGPTHYLMKLKKKIFIYSFTKKMKVFSFVGAQVMTAILIFVIAVLHRSLMSFGYMILCGILLYNMKQFFYLDMLQRQGKQWINPYIISGPLLFYCFIDVSLQILYQIPFFPSVQEGQKQRYLGFDKIYDQNESVTGLADLISPTGETINYISYLNFQNLFFLVLKSMNLFFIFLQARIYKSHGYSKFIRGDLRTLMNMGSNYKRLIITYIYNNKKLEQIIQVQQKKKNMYKKLDELKDEVRGFQRQQNSLLRGLFDQRPTQETQGSMTNNSKTPLLQPGAFRADAGESSISSALMKEKLTDQQKLAVQKGELLEELNKNFKMEKLRMLNEEDPNFERKKKLYKKAKAKLGTCSKLYLWINKSYINQVLFVETVDEATKIKEQTSKGILKASNDLKNAMKYDINLIVEARIAMRKDPKAKKVEEYNIQLEDMPETQEFLKFGRLFVALIESIPKAFLSQAAAFSYIFMILSMILNAGFISILYPFGVFGYALMEEGRPGKKFWNMMSAYTIFILTLKLIAQLDIWYLVGIESSYYAVNSYLILGIYRVEGIINLFIYIIPEFLVLSFVWTQQFYEILVGLHDEREIEVEDIEMARDRFLGQFSEQAKKIMTATRKVTMRANPKSDQQPVTLVKQEFVEEEPIGEDGLTYTQRSAFFLAELKNIKSSQKDGSMTRGDVHTGTVKLRGTEDFACFMVKDGERKELEDYVNSQKELKSLNITLPVDEDERKLVVKQIKDRNRSGVQNMVKSMGSYQHFKNLFPIIKEQKPGKDLYGKITFWQFIICVYLISYYTHLDARGTQNLESTNQYSFNMVVMLFIQVAVMIIERYISRTNTRVQKRGEDAKKRLAAGTINGTQNNNSHKTTRRMTSMLVGTFKSTSADDEFNKLKDYTQLSVTKITFQQVLKWIIQVVLLLMYHFTIFWLFPLASNEALYGQPHCNREVSIFKKYGCYDFSENIYLIVFYMIMCQYFMLSALQIRHGYPDWREPSSLTVKNETLPWLGNMIFYNLPFMVEFKTVLDWCFTKTSLDVFQWLELAEINVAMYNANNNKALYNRKLGTKVSGFEKKFCGCICLGIMLFFLVGPFMFFSDLRYIADENPVYDARIGVTVVINEKIDGQPNRMYEFPLFHTDSPTSIFPMSEQTFTNKSYDTRPETKFFEYSQVQIVRMKKSSDDMWSASLDYKLLFQDLLKNATNPNSTQKITVQAILSYQFERPLPVIAQLAEGNLTKDIDNILEFQAAASLNCSADPSATFTIHMNDFMAKRVRLGESTTVKPLIIEDDDFKNLRNVNLIYSCQNYWSVTQEEEDQGIQVEVFSDIISTGFFSESSILGFYLGVALTFGTIFRTIVMYKADRIFIVDAPNTDKVRNLIACIFRQRLEQNLKKEEELYFLMFEILRSPELYKYLTGSSLKGEMDPANQKAIEQA